MLYSGIILSSLAFVLFESVLYTNAWTPISKNGPLIQKITCGAASAEFRKRIPQCDNVRKRTSGTDIQLPNSLWFNALKRQKQLEENLKRLQNYLQENTQSESDYFDSDADSFDMERPSPMWNFQEGYDLSKRDFFDSPPASMNSVRQEKRNPPLPIRTDTKTDVLDQLYRILLKKSYGAASLIKRSPELEEES